MYKIARFLNILGLHVAFDRLYSTHHLQHYTNHSLKKLLQQNGFDIILQRNRNYPMKAVDVPESSFLIERLYKGIVLLIFLLSSIFKSGIYQIVICRKGNVLKKTYDGTK